ncbi:MAG: hypothetical protein AAGH57_11010 [Pseudomonadota bacterium]
MLLAGGCGAANTTATTTDDAGDRSALALVSSKPPEESVALMTSLPIYWPMGVGLADIASGEASTPWPRVFLERRYTLVPLDTLSPIAALPGEATDSDPLDGIQRLAIIQPRGLSPADNAALDRWVRGGGRLLMALDPALSGHYALPLGDPRLPSYTALIPPVVAHWGLAIRFYEAQREPLTSVGLPGEEELILRTPGEISALAGSKGGCRVEEPAPMVQCAIGEGRVTLLADAAVFEHRELAGSTGQRLRAVMAYAFE